MVFGRPRMCNPETQWSIARWVTDHPQFPCYSDAMLAASQGSGGLINGMRQHKAFEPDGIRFKMTVHQFQADFAKWDATWFGAESVSFVEEKFSAALTSASASPGPRPPDIDGHAPVLRLDVRLRILRVSTTQHAWAVDERGNH